MSPEQIFKANGISSLTPGRTVALTKPFEYETTNQFSGAHVNTGTYTGNRFLGQVGGMIAGALNLTSAAPPPYVTPSVQPSVSPVNTGYSMTYPPSGGILQSLGTNSTSIINTGSMTYPPSRGILTGNPMGIPPLDVPSTYEYANTRVQDMTQEQQQALYAASRDERTGASWLKGTARYGQATYWENGKIRNKDLRNTSGSGESRQRARQRAAAAAAAEQISVASPYTSQVLTWRV
jgi:hypothetical protein